MALEIRLKVWRIGLGVRGGATVGLWGCSGGVALAGLVEPDFGEVAIQIMQIFFSFRLTSILPSLDFGDNKLVQVFLFLVDII
jgi:hypothetical protein